MNLQEAITALKDGKRIRYRDWSGDEWIEFDAGRGPYGSVLDQDDEPATGMWYWEGWETVPKGVEHSVLFVQGDPGEPTNNMVVEIKGVRYQLIR